MESNSNDILLKTKKRGLPWTNKENRILKKNYRKQNRYEIFKKLMPDRSFVATRSQLCKLGLKKKTFYVKKENFFDVPNLDNCVSAGIIGSDGCVSNTKAKKLSFSFAEKDFEFWDKFKNLLGFNGKYYICHRKAAYSKSLDTIISEGTSYSFVISMAKHWAQKLQEHWNIVPCKSLILEPPTKLTDIDQIFSYISGIICGDGTIYTGRRNKLVISILGTEKLLNWIKSHFDLIVPFTTNASVRKKGDENVFVYSISYIKAYALAKYFLSLPIIRMDRKWNRAIEYINIVENNPIRQHDYNKLMSIANPKLKQLIGVVNWQIKGKDKKENATNQ